jgi:hypothetical protein
LEHLTTYKQIKERLLAKELLLHGWWFDIKSADVYSFSERKQRFVLMDDEKVEELLKKIEEIEQNTHTKSGSGTPNAEPHWLNISLPKNDEQ